MQSYLHYGTSSRKLRAPGVPELTPAPTIFKSTTHNIGVYPLFPIFYAKESVINAFICLQMDFYETSSGAGEGCGFRWSAGLRRDYGF